MVDPTERRSKPPHTDDGDDISLDRREPDRRRRSVRMSLRLWTEGRVDGRLDFYNCSNLSEGGLFVETTEPYPMGTEVQLEFNLPGQYEPVRSLVRVVSTLDEETAEEAMMGNGFEFLRIEGDGVERIRSFVARHTGDGTEDEDRSW